MTPFSLLDGTIQGVRWGRGTPVLAFHGYLDHAYSFKRLAEQLPDIEIWAIDLPGHGLSDGLPKMPGTSLLTYLPILGKVLDELNWPEYRILGHSMGAALSQLLAAVDDRVVQLISMDALGPVASPSFNDNFKRFKKLYSRRHQQVPTKYYPTYEALVNSRLGGMFPLSANAAAVMAQRGVKVTQKGWAHRYDRDLRQESLWRLTEEDVCAWLSEVSIPVHLAVFAVDRWPGHEQAFLKRCEQVRQLNKTEMRGSHHLHLENPEPVAEWVNTTLQN